MTVKSIQPSNKQHDHWRRLYIRLLTEEMRPWDDLTPEERTLELGVIEDLVDAGYMSGSVIKGGDGIPAAATTRGPTLAGRIFAEEQQDILDKKSLWGHIKSGAGLFIGWLAGIISALIIWRLTR
ncbi:MAG TPA: hypothetical protein VFV23_04135 [Verrucomicrobiae bacterium]|nr:hypothetical protein [Verrucomicrobiae bacterium]